MSRSRQLIAMFAIAVSASLGGAVGCTTATLAPTYPARTTEYENGGVSVLIEPAGANAFGASRFAAPLAVVIENQRDRPIAVSYRNFSVEEPDGNRYVTINPNVIRAEVSQARREAWRTERDQRLSTAAWLAFAPRSANGGSPTGVPRQELSPYSQREPLKSPAIQSESTPSFGLPLVRSRLASGAKTFGYVYFQRVPRRRSHLVLVARFEDAATHNVVATLRIPLEPT